MKYKIVEKFHSIQGEGYWTGTPMAFVRLAQCPVGGALGICKSWNGEEFLCDTGRAYHDSRVHKSEHHSYTEVNEELTAEEIVEWANRKHICITGGEPFIYDLSPLLRLYHMLHVETSGTVPIPIRMKDFLWLTVSPKFNYLPESLRCADEIKLLVHHQTSVNEIGLIRKEVPNKDLYLQPIENRDWQQNLRRAIELCEQIPNCKLSVQLHKYLGLR